MGSRARIIREVGHVEGVDLSRAEGLVVAGDVVEGGECEVVEDEVAVERVAVEPQLVAEADPRHVRARRGREPARAVGPRGRRRLPRRGQRRRRHRSARGLPLHPPSKQKVAVPVRRVAAARRRDRGGDVAQRIRGLEQVLQNELILKTYVSL